MGVILAKVQRFNLLRAFVVVLLRDDFVKVYERNLLLLRRLFRPFP